MEYTVVYVDRSVSCSGVDQLLKELEAKVNALINQGWKPQGGICISTGQISMPGFLYQAMVK